MNIAEYFFNLLKISHITSVISLTFERLRQENYHELKTSLCYIVSFREPGL